MHRRRRANGWFAALVTIALIAGCSPTTTTPSLAASIDATGSAVPTPIGSGAAVTPSLAAYQVPPAAWSDCGKGFLCAEIRVPRDYSVPASGYLNLSIVRLAATDPGARIGSLVVDPGGPGASGVDFVRQAADAGSFSDALRRRFDIIGLDPRGVNGSSPIRCIEDLEPRDRLDPSPDDPAELKALVDSAREYAGECGKRNDATLPYLSTDAVARDLDLIRSAIGDKQLTYFGFSYGTLIGSLYADLYPDHLRAMVLDGAVDPALDLEQIRSGQANGFEAALTHFLEDCAAKTSCAFHENGGAAKAFDSLMTSIETKPLHTVLVKGRRQIGPSIAWYTVLAALYAKSTWPTLAAALALAKRGDGSLMLLIADPYRGRNPDGSYSNQQDAYTANTCLDFAAPTDVTVYSAWAKELKATAPHFAGLMAYNDLACAFWPVPAERTPRAVKAAGAPPIVVVGSTGDPATPYSWAVALAKELDSGVLIKRTGEGHTGYQASKCVSAAVDAYLLDLTVPKDGLACTK
jgi:pimeloyl-ACP methyl ester carboxylesterase